LRCFQRDSDEDVPGCEGSGVDSYDYCVDADLMPALSSAPSESSAPSSAPSENSYLSSSAPSKTPALQLGHCETGCSNHLDCALGHNCYDVFSPTMVTVNPPDCGSQTEELLNGNQNFCHEAREKELVFVGDDLDPGVLQECQGDCDDDVDCAVSFYQLCH
jgi:hypothetical protein